MQPYQTDYELVVDEIIKQTTGKQRIDSDVEKDIFSDRRQDFLEETSLMQSMESYNADLQNLADSITMVEDVIKRMDQYITSGLDASVTGVNKVKITAGEGVAYGIIQSLAVDQEVTITFNDVTPVYYLQIDKNAVVVNKYEDVKMLTVGRIIVPYPGQTTEIQDDRPWAPYGEDTGYNGWIESAKDAFFGEDTTFDDSSREVIRDALSHIAAEIIFGTLTASESLKITNVHGTAVLTSRAMEFKNSEGEVVSRYGSDYARIGNIAIYPTYLASTNFEHKKSGFKIDSDGEAEFENVLIRGRLSTVVFEKNTVSSVGGSFLVSRSDVLAENMTSADNSVLTISGDEIFEVGDVLRIKDGIDDEWFVVTDASDAPTYVVARDRNAAYDADENPTWQTGTAVISYGQAGEGVIFMTASEEDSPYMDIMTHTGSPWNTIDTRVRLGNLAGINDAEYGALTGYGLYATNVFLKGSLYAPDIKTSVAGSRIELNSDGLFAYDALDNSIFNVLLTTVAGIGDTGDVVIGDILGNVYMKWDNSEGKLIVADIESPDYVANTTGYKLSATTGLEVNTGNIVGSVVLVNTIPVDRILNWNEEVGKIAFALDLMGI